MEPTLDGCAGCGAELRWIDDAHACPSGCAFCSECAEQAGGNCPNCAEPLRRQRRAQPVGRPPKPAG